MPKLDGTGPQGKGPGTGRGKGFCSDPQKDYPQTPSKITKVDVPKKEKSKE